MSKIFLVLLLTVVTMSALNEDVPNAYKFQDNMVLVNDILNLGYSVDQKHLVVLQNGVQDHFLIYEGIQGDKKS